MLAQQLGTNYRSLMYWLRGQRPIPAYLLPRICALLNNYEALDCLESESGRVAFKIPEPHFTSEKELLAVSHLIREVGEALESVAETIADGTIEESELKTTIPRIEAVIQECASLKYLLEDLGRKKKGSEKLIVPTPDNRRVADCAEIPFAEYCTRVQQHLEKDYGIAVITRDIPDPLTGDLDGLQIHIDYTLNPEQRLFMLAHLFGHTVQCLP